jgi:quercetin dioxygenase-like cupin family protein
MDGIALGPGDGRRVSKRLVIKAGREEIVVTETDFEAGRCGPPPLVHRLHADSFYVLEGELEFHVGDEVVTATAGSYVLAPPNVVHWFRNVSDEPARMLNLHTPGGFAQYRRELGELRTQGIEPDREFFERHDVFDVD